MENFLRFPDQNSEEIQRKIRRNEAIAKEAMRVIAKRHKNLPPQECFESITNTIGILAAQAVADCQDTLGLDVARAIREMIIFHIDNQLKAKN